MRVALGFGFDVLEKDGPFSRGAAVWPPGHHTLCFQPPGRFEIRRVVAEPDEATAFFIVDLRVGALSQLVNASGLPAVALVGTGFTRAFDPVHCSQTVSLRILNEKGFRARLVAYAVGDLDLGKHASAREYERARALRVAGRALGILGENE